MLSTVSTTDSSTGDSTETVQSRGAFTHNIAACRGGSEGQKRHPNLTFKPFAPLRGVRQGRGWQSSRNSNHQIAHAELCAATALVIRGVVCIVWVMLSFQWHKTYTQLMSMTKAKKKVMMTVPGVADER